MAAADRFLIDGLGYGQTAVAAQMVLQKVGKIRHHVSHYQTLPGKLAGRLEMIILRIRKILRNRQSR